MRTAAGVHCVLLEDGSTELEIVRGMKLALNPVASRIWRKIETGAAEEQIAQEIAAEFDAPIDVVCGDLRELLNELEDNLLLDTGGLA